MSLRLVVLDTEDTGHCGDCGRTLVPEPGEPETITADTFVAAWVDGDGNVRAISSEAPLPARLLDVLDTQVARTVSEAARKRAERETKKLLVSGGS